MVSPGSLGREALELRIAPAHPVALSFPSWDFEYRMSWMLGAWPAWQLLGSLAPWVWL